MPIYNMCYLKFVRQFEPVNAFGFALIKPAL